jgi:5-methylcytosine-specific restriction endonuclease McrA
MNEFQPWIEYPHIWNTQAKFMSWVRGGVRLGLWKQHPVKLEFLKASTTLIVNTNPRSMKRFPMVKAVTCALCKETVKASEAEVDHIRGNHSLKSMDDLRSFIESMIIVKMSDLQIACKPCHKIKSYSEREGISFEHARAIKRAIEICKNKQDKQFLIERGIKPANSAAGRRTQVEVVLKEET